jgi:hypothetical protein
MGAIAADLVALMQVGAGSHILHLQSVNFASPSVDPGIAAE